MAFPTSVRIPMEGVGTSLGTVAIPKIRIRFPRSDAAGWSAPYTALVDTGAWTTLVRDEIADLLGLRAIVSAGELIRFVGVDGKEHPGRKVSLNVLVGPTDPDKCLSVSDATICFTTQDLPYPVLLGQRDILERFELNHRNQQPAPEFVLRRP